MGTRVGHENDRGDWNYALVLRVLVAAVVQAGGAVKIVSPPERRGVPEHRWDARIAGLICHRMRDRMERMLPEGLSARRR